MTLIARLKRLAPLIIEVVGIVALCAGVFWYSLPAGLLVSGVILVVLAQGIGRRDAPQ